MTDYGIIRSALMVLYSRLVDKGYAPQSGQPDSADLFNAALAALDRVEGVGQSQHSVGHGVDFYLEQVPEYRQLKAENARLREALRLALEAYDSLSEYEGGTHAWEKAEEARKVLEEKA